jgi:hypothetical protein
MLIFSSIICVLTFFFIKILTFIPVNPCLFLATIKNNRRRNVCKCPRPRYVWNTLAYNLIHFLRQQISQFIVVTFASRSLIYFYSLHCYSFILTLMFCVLCWEFRIVKKKVPVFCCLWRWLYLPPPETS